ncbi:general odorant-binding protein 28a-like [Calliphora vicina]|uniref:general odorant-binding protein 28a-like n=1 Tax=Calliphora vicina TaxID=7373 RepID=UPI00325ADEBE
MAKLFVNFVIFGAFVAVLVNGFDKEAAMDTFVDNLSECQEEVGAQHSDLEDLVDKKPSSTMEGKCLRACIMKKYEMMDDNGKFSKDVAEAHAQEYTEGSEDKLKIAHEIIDACSSIEVDDDHCEAAEQYGQCMKEQAMAHNIDDAFGY